MNSKSKGKRYQQKKKNLLIVNMHFWPDKSSCSAIMFHIAETLNKNFEKVKIITSKPKRFKSDLTNSELKEIDNKTDLVICRLPLLKENLNALPRIFNAFCLGIFAIFEIIFGNYEFVVATSSPPVLTSFLVALASKLKGIKFIYYCMDINPEIGILSGDFRNNVLKSILFAVDKFSCRQAKPVIVHSNSMRRSLQKRFRKQDLDVKIINSFSVPLKENNIRINPKQNINKGLKIIYAGNIGRFQGLENIIYAFNYLSKYKDIELTFLGDGKEKFRLENLSKKLKTNIKFHNYVSYETSKEFIRESDLGLISLIPNMYKYAYPSKTMVYLEQGVPILGLLEKNSDLGKTIIKNEIGFVSDRSDHKSIANLLIKLNNNPSWKFNIKQKCLETFESEFSKEIMLEKWNNLFFYK